MLPPSGGVFSSMEIIAGAVEEKGILLAATVKDGVNAFRIATGGGWRAEEAKAGGVGGIAATRVAERTGDNDPSSTSMACFISYSKEVRLRNGCIGERGEQDQ